MRILMLGLLFLGACASYSETDFEPGPQPVNYEEDIMNYLNRNLKDPDSIKNLKIKDLTPVRGKEGAFGLSGGIYGETYRGHWAACVEYNAKNSYGAYVGLKGYYYMFRYGAISVFENSGCVD